MSKIHELSRVTVCLTDEELQSLEAQANKRKMPRSALIKEAIAVAVKPPTKKNQSNRLSSWTQAKQRLITL